MSQFDYHYIYKWKTNNKALHQHKQDKINEQRRIQQE